MSDIIKDMVAWHFKTNHKGRCSNISADSLAKNIGIGKRTLREVITALRQDGVAVVGTPVSGYYLAQTLDEVDEGCKHLRKRALKSLYLESRIRNIAVHEILGQMRIEQEQAFLTTTGVTTHD